jgi:hypothetical protein
MIFKPRNFFALNISGEGAKFVVFHVFVSNVVCVCYSVMIANCLSRVNQITKIKLIALATFSAFP